MGYPFWSVAIYHLRHCHLLYDAEGLSARLRLSRKLMDLDIILCGNWAGLPSVYSATSGGGKTGVCISFPMLSANGVLK